MTIFTIPEGKVVDRIELEAGEGKATINIIYKEERQKEKKKAFAVVSTDQPTCVYLDLSKNKLTSNFPNFSARDYIPVGLAEANEYIVLPRDSLRTAVTKVESCLSTCVCPGHAIDVAWRELNELFVEPK